MPILYNFANKKGVFMIPSGGTKSPTPAPPSFNNTKSLAFDGVDDYVDLGSATTLNFTNDFTVSAWIKETGSLNRGIICCGNRSLSSGWHIYRTSANKVAFAVYTANNRIAISTTLINTGDWFNVIGTFEKNGTASQQVKVYVNGSLEGQNGWASAQTPSYSGTIYKQIGFPYAGSNEFLGNIDEVSAFNYLLSTDEINTISTTPTDLTSLSPTAWYRMGDNSTFKTPQILMPENTNKDNVSNYSFSYDGVDDYVDISDTATLSGKAIISLSVWIKPNSISGSNERIFDENTSTAGYTRFGLERDTDTIQLKWRDASNDPSGSAGTLTTGSVLTAGVWTHILAIYDSSSNEQKIYIDGSLSTSSSVSVSALGTSTTHGINIGRSPNSLDYFNGVIDELSIWDTNQSANASAIYNSGTPTTITGAIAYWKLGEEATFSTNWTVPDQVASNDGTSANMTIEDRVGTSPNSDNNAVSLNMAEADIEEEVP